MNTPVPMAQARRIPRFRIGCFLRCLMFVGIAVALWSGSRPASAKEPSTTLPEGVEYFSDNPYFAVEKLNERLYAISEPTYYQKNFSYLIVGDDKALLVDAGASWTEDIGEVARSITDKVLSVIPTHLHTDHIGSLPAFDDVWMIDVPSMRELETEPGRLTIPESKSFASIDGHGDMTVDVSRYVAPGEAVDLGGIEVQVLSMPGHSLEEIVVHLPSLNVFLTGDHIYPDVIVVGELDIYVNSVTELLDISNPETVYLGAHGSFEESVGTLPRVSYGEASALLDTFKAIQASEIEGEPLQVPNFMDSGTYFSVTDRIGVIMDLVLTGGRAFHH